jgi:AraC family transcriptional regulator
MDWIERMNMAINYIEEHILEELDFSKVAKVVGCSTYHFQRMFLYMTDITLAKYIQRRRMSLAVGDLKSGENKIIDVSLKYGYNSPTAFNRAFQSVHGIAPSLIKLEGVVVKSYPPISFKISIKGVEGLNYRIEKKEAFRIVGISTSLDQDYEVGWETIPQMWQLAERNGTIDKLATLMDGEPIGNLGVIISDDLRYFLAVASTKEIDHSLEEYIVPSFTWAIFSGMGKYPEAICDLETRIVNEWLPTSGYEIDNGPDIEVRLNKDSNDTRFEVWIPVKKSEIRITK